MKEGNTKLRVVAVVLLLVIGAGCLGFAFNELLSPDSGWTQIEATASEGPTCADDFVFLYYFEGGTISVANQNREVTRLYSDAARKAYQLFNLDESYADVVNLYTLNHSPNEIFTVDPVLYEAFALLEASGNRTIYLGPVYERYNDVFLCQDDSQLVDFDPFLNDEVRAEYAEAAAFAMDPNAVSLELLGENRVRLSVSREYLSYAEEWGVVNYLDFGYLKNAFLVDYLADTMIGAGFTAGSISSFDGCCRNLDSTGAADYAFNIYDRVGGQNRIAGAMHYQGEMSIVFLRDYPISGRDSLQYYTLKNGEVRHSYLDPADGTPKAALPGLTGYSKELSCAEILVVMAPWYVRDTFPDDALGEIHASGVETICTMNQKILYSQEDLTLTDLYQGYTAEHHD